MILALQLSVGALLIGFVCTIVLWNFLEKRVRKNEDQLWAMRKELDTTASAIDRVCSQVAELKSAMEKQESVRCYDSKLLSKEIAAVAEDVTTLVEDFRKLDEKVSDAYEVVETQAKKEKLMFDGLTSIMDYDVNTARKAVSGDAE